MQYSLKHHLLSVMAAGLITLGPAVNAASQCKELSREDCSADPSCAWVDGYVRKDGREVRAYCRTVPAKKQARQSARPGQESGTRG